MSIAITPNIYKAATYRFYSQVIVFCLRYTLYERVLLALRYLDIIDLVIFVRYFISGYRFSTTISI